VTLAAVLSAPAVVYAEGSISVQDAIAKIRAAHVIKPETDLSLAVNDKLAIVQVERPPTETDNDCKIDGVLIAKTLVEAYPTGISNVKVLFLKDRSDGIEIPVSATQLKDYASGKIDKHALLDFIPVNKVASSSPLPVQSKPAGKAKAHIGGNRIPNYFELLARIQAYEAQGQDMSSYRKQLDQIPIYRQKKDLDSAKALRKELARELHFDPQ